MSTRALFQVLKWRLPPSQKLVALFYADQANDDGESFFTVSRCVEWTSLSERAVRTARKALEAQGKIRRVSRPGRSPCTVLDIADDPTKRAERRGANNAGGGASNAGGGADNAPLYKEPLTSPTYLPSKRRDINRDQSQKGSVGDLSNPILLKLCKAQGIATIGRTREQLLTALRQKRA